VRSGCLRWLLGSWRQPPVARRYSGGDVGRPPSIWGDRRTGRRRRPLADAIGRPPSASSDRPLIRLAKPCEAAHRPALSPGRDEQILARLHLGVLGNDLPVATVEVLLHGLLLRFQTEPALALPASADSVIADELAVVLSHGRLQRFQACQETGPALPCCQKHRPHHRSGHGRLAGEACGADRAGHAECGGRARPKNQSRCAVGVPIEGTCDVERYQLTRIDSSTRHSRPMPVSVRTKGPSAPHAGGRSNPGWTTNYGSLDVTMPRYRQAGLAISPMARLRGYRTPHDTAAGTRALGGRILFSVRLRLYPPLELVPRCGSPAGHPADRWLVPGRASQVPVTA